MRSFLLSLPLATGLFALPGCGAAPEEQAGAELVGSESEEIKGGYLDDKDTGVVGVGLFQQNYLIGICTGSLIAPNVVLTAHHCVADVLNEDPQLGIVCSKTSFGDNYAAASLGVTTKSKMGDTKTSAYHKVTEVVTQTGTDLLCGNDQAILILADNLDPTEAKVLVPASTPRSPRATSTTPSATARRRTIRTAPAPARAAAATSSSSTAPAPSARTTSSRRSRRWSSSAIRASARATPAAPRSTCKTGSSASPRAAGPGARAPSTATSSASARG